MGLTKIRAGQISNIDYKQSCRVLTDTNVTLSGGAPAEVDGVSLAADDRVLVIGQTNKAQNGLYRVDILGTGSDGTWVRTGDTDTQGELEAGAIVMVTEGTVYKDTQWKLITNDPITIGTTELTFEQNSAFAFGNIAANGTAVLANTVGDTVTFTAGDNISITGNATAKSVTFAVTGISLNSISNGTSNVTVVSSGGNVTVGIADSEVAEFSTVGQDLTGALTVSGNTNIGSGLFFVNTSSNRIGVGTATPDYPFEIETTGTNSLLVLTRTDGAACFIEGQASRSAFGSVGATPLALAYNSLAVVTIGAGGAITVNPDGGNPYTLPIADGNANELLATDGAGNVDFTATPSVTTLTASGNITGGNILGNGAGLTGINVFSNVAISGGNAVVADSISDTLTLIAGDGISLTGNAAADSITIALTGSSDSIFATGGDMGTVEEAVTSSEDLGLVTDAATTEIDMGTIVTSGVIYPDQLVLPSYTVSELGSLSAVPAAQMVFCTDETGGAVPAFSDGTNWRRVTDRAIVS